MKDGVIGLKKCNRKPYTPSDLLATKLLKEVNPKSNISHFITKDGVIGFNTQDENIPLIGCLATGITYSAESGHPFRR